MIVSTEHKDYYIRYLDRNKKRQGKNEMEGTSQQCETVSEEIIITNEMKSIKSWLLCNIEPANEVNEKWKATFPLRRSEILSKNNENEKLTVLLTQWPLLSRPNAFL